MGKEWLQQKYLFIFSIFFKTRNTATFQNFITTVEVRLLKYTMYLTNVKFTKDLI